MPASCYSYEIRSLPSRCHKTFCCCTAHYPKRRATVVDCIEELQQQTPLKSRDPPVCHHQCEELLDLQHCRNCSSMVPVTGGVRSVTLTIQQTRFSCEFLSKCGLFSFHIWKFQRPFTRGSILAMPLAKYQSP